MTVNNVIIGNEYKVDGKNREKMNTEFSELEERYEKHIQGNIEIYKNIKKYIV